VLIGREPERARMAELLQSARHGSAGCGDVDGRDPVAAVASTAGSLTTASGAADAFSRGFLGAAAMGALVAVFAVLRMSKTVAAGGGGHVHMH